MKVHYINILLFSLPLNILSHSKNKTYITHHTPKITTTRLLCEYDLYAPANYDNDPQMKEVMENFSKQTEERFHEYDERMKTTRQKCKDKCDKEIQKIILKDKLEKELTEKLSTLKTDIRSEAIPTCICEKSMADKVENFCLNCGLGLGSGVLQASSLLGGIGAVAANASKPTALNSAIEAAKQAAASNISAAAEAAGNAKGMEIVTAALEENYIKTLIPGLSEEISRIGHYTKVTSLDEFIYGKYRASCAMSANDAIDNMCGNFDIAFRIKGADGSALGAPDKSPITETLTEFVAEAKQGADAAAKSATDNAIAEITKEQTALIEGGFNSTITSIYAAIIAIVVIILVMVIIYKILRYRRKKKMKKKLQYIKLLEE
ncbi:rifin PIR protein, putative [Plasmodium reichenowi]|uniref:Rifin PIR protein, putative n=1 Tax=Plasmodium reichenowi TaxID=5854 RepID=A0A2P9DHF7_PLARE|nr:rifin PIR protein, putative [Plasmodium reichenowi]